MSKTWQPYALHILDCVAKIQREISGFRHILVHNYFGDIDSLTIKRVIVHIPIKNLTPRPLSLTGEGEQELHCLLAPLLSRRGVGGEVLLDGCEQLLTCSVGFDFAQPTDSDRSLSEVEGNNGSGNKE